MNKTIASLLALAFSVFVPCFVPVALAADSSVARPWTQKPVEGLTPGADAPVDLHNGSFHHAIDIDVPDFRDLEPDANLAFDSSAGNGFAGVGWSVTGFSAIERVAASGRGSRSCTAADSYVLDGEPLVACTALGGTHCTKSQSFRRIRFDAAADRWTIWDKNGTKSTYDKTFEVNGCQFRYGLTAVEDTKGNKVSYSWFTDDTDGGVHKEVYPASISYNGATVTFFRELRPDPVTYGNGFDWSVQRYRLKSVLVSVRSTGAAGGGITQNLRAYQLAYSTSPTTGRSRLISVAQLGRDVAIDGAGSITAGAVLTKQTFSYAGGSVGFAQEIASSSFSDALGWADITNYSTIQTPDIDGDGKADICGRANIGIYCYRSTGQSWTAFAGIQGSPALADAQGWNKPQYYSSIQFPDLNGDGKADLCARGVAGLDCWLNDGAGSPSFSHRLARATEYADASGWNDVKYYSTIRYADINGDGKDDICARGVAGISCRVMGADGWGARVDGPDWTNAKGWTDPSNYSTIQFADINGDGKSDVCARANNGIQCHLSTGTGFGAQAWVGPAWSDANGWADVKYYSTIRFPDINGDGKADICARSKDGVICHLAIGSARVKDTFYAFNTIAISTGQMSNASGFDDPKYYQTMQFTDINGDGRQDLCFRTAAGINCHRSNGGSFVSAVSASPPWSDALGWGDVANYSTIRFVDLDGDGKADILARSNNGLRAHKTVGDGPERLTAITNNGLGGSVNVTYAPSSQFKNVNNPPIDWVVTATTVDDGRGHRSTSSFSYEGGQFDRANQRALGFRYVKQTLPALGNETAAPVEERWFMQQPYACVGEVDYLKRSTGAGRLLKYSQHVYQTAGTDAGPFTCLLDQKSDHIYDASGNSTCTAQDNTHCKRTDVNYDYDSYGNVTLSYDYGDYFSASDDTTKETFFTLNLTSYIVGTAMVERLHPGIGTAAPMIEESRTFYDGATALETPPLAGLPTMTQQWVSSIGGPMPAPAYTTRKKGFDAFGNVVWEEDTLGNRTTHRYDAVFHQFVEGNTNPLGQSTSATWDTVCGEPLTRTDLNQQVTRLQYDAFCRLVRQDEPLGGFELHTYSALGDAKAQWNRTETPPVPGIDGNVYQASYLDGLGRVYRTQQRGPDATIDDDIMVDSEFDDRGNVRTRSLPYQQGTPTVVTTFDFDELNRPLKATHADGVSTSTSYALWTVTITDEVGKQVARTVDADGRLVVMSERDDATWNAALFTYDPLGNPTRTVDPAGNVTTYDFNSLDQKLAQDDPDLGASSYTYDSNGLLLTETDARGERTELGYDPLGRMVSKKLGAQRTQPQVITYVHDEGRAGAFNVGYLTTMIDDAGGATYDHDAAGRVVGETRLLDGATHTFARSFDAGDRLLGIRFPDGDVVGDDPATAALEPSLLYDAAGNLRSIPGLVDSVSYHPSGQLAEIANRNGTTSTRSYSPTRSWLDSIRTMRGPTRVQDLTFARDGEGKINVVAGPIAGDAWSYGYDVLGRLTRATRSTGATEEQTFSYDRLGNMMTNSRLGAYQYPPTGAPRPHAVTAAGDRSFRYDAAGNMLEGNGRGYEWDAASRLVKVTAGSDVTTFVYDGNGTRVAKTFNGAVTRYLGEDYEIGSDGTATKYFRVAGELVAKKVGAKLFWLHANHIDSVAVITDQAGNDVRRQNQRAYGEPLESAGSQEDAFAFTGQRVDETGLVYLHARYYDPAIGRFLSPDSETPGDLIVALNRYAYGNNDPVNHTDPTGHFGWKGFLRFTVVAVAGIGGAVLCGPACAAGATFLAGTAWDLVDNRHHLGLKTVGRIVGLNAFDATVSLGVAEVGPFAGVEDSMVERSLFRAKGGFRKMPRSGNPAKRRLEQAEYDRITQQRAAIRPKLTEIAQKAGQRGRAVTAGLEVGPASGIVHGLHNSYDGFEHMQHMMHMQHVHHASATRSRVSAQYIADTQYTSANAMEHRAEVQRASAPPSRSGGGGCFVAGTRVTMADGTQKAIDQIQVGEQVLAFDEKSARLMPARVTERFVHPDWKEQADTILINGRLRATTNHPFLVNGRWQRADQIQPGDIFHTLTPILIDNGPVRTMLSEPVLTLVPLPGVETVYNLEVDGYHTYFAEGVLVHNMKAAAY
ncbi:MAG: hypothetical protein QOI66_938 [Myxococcales bacterium]|nr:hypothetical protein [Myxococcales bacterium]